MGKVADGCVDPAGPVAVDRSRLRQPHVQRGIQIKEQACGLPVVVGKSRAHQDVCVGNHRRAVSRQRRVGGGGERKAELRPFASHRAGRGRSGLLEVVVKGSKVLQVQERPRCGMRLRKEERSGVGLLLRRVEQAAPLHRFPLLVHRKDVPRIKRNLQIECRSQRRSPVEALPVSGLRINIDCDALLAGRRSDPELQPVLFIRFLADDATSFRHKGRAECRPSSRRTLHQDPQGQIPDVHAQREVAALPLRKRSRKRLKLATERRRPRIKARRGDFRQIAEIRNRFAHELRWLLFCPHRTDRHCRFRSLRRAVRILWNSRGGGSPRRQKSRFLRIQARGYSSCRT